MEGFLHYEFGRAFIWRGLFSELYSTYEESIVDLWVKQLTKQ